MIDLERDHDRLEISASFLSFVSFGKYGSKLEALGDLLAWAISQVPEGKSPQ